MDIEVQREEFDDEYALGDWDYLDTNQAIGFDTWACAKCGEEYVDPEDYPEVLKANELRGRVLTEPRLYWLSLTEPVCYTCASRAGLPPIDDQD